MPTKSLLKLKYIFGLDLFPLFCANYLEIRAAEPDRRENPAVTTNRAEKQYGALRSRCFVRLFQ